MKRRFFESMVTIVLEGSDRRTTYYAERLEKIAKGMYKKMLVGSMDNVQGKMMRMTSTNV